MKYLLILSAFLASAVFASPVLVGKVSGTSPCFVDCPTEYTVAVSQLGAAVGDQLVVVVSSGPTAESGGWCPTGWPAGWSLVVSKSTGGPSTGRNLCAYTKASTGSDADFTLYKAEEHGAVWAAFRISGASSAVGAIVSGGNPPSLNLGSSAATVWLAAEYGKATTHPAGYTGEVSLASGGVRGASLSVASYATSAASEDPGAFAPLGGIAATLGIR